jgi:hypothetical protein
MDAGELERLWDEKQQGQLPRASDADERLHPRWSEEEQRILRYDEVEPRQLSFDDPQ